MSKWIYGPIAILALLILEPILFALDPFLITTATSSISSRLTDQISAPFYGYDADEPFHVSGGTQSVVVLLLDDETIDGMVGVDAPMELQEEWEFYISVLGFKPRLVVSDRLHAFDKPHLDTQMALLSQLARDFGSEFLIAGAGDGGRRAHENVRRHLDVSPVIHSGFDKTYPLMVENPADRSSEPNLALKALIKACGPGWGRGAALPGCRDIDRLKSLPAGAAAHIQYGSLSRSAWFLRDQGIRVSQVSGGRRKTCREFEADRWSRARETAAQMLSAITPLFSASALDEACPYPLTLSGDELADIANEDFVEFYRAALEDKIVFIGFKSDRPLDLTPILSGRDASIYAHAMMTINLLDQGVDRIEPATDLGAVFAETFGAKNLGNLNVQQDWVIESAVTILMVGAYFIMYFTLIRDSKADRRRREARLRMEQDAGFDTQMFLIWYGLFAIFVSGGLWFSYSVLSWPGFNWVGSLVYTEGMRVLVLRQLAR